MLVCFFVHNYYYKRCITSVYGTFTSIVFLWSLVVVTQNAYRSDEEYDRLVHNM